MVWQSWSRGFTGDSLRSSSEKGAENSPVIDPEVETRQLASKGHAPSIDSTIHPSSMQGSSAQRKIPRTRLDTTVCQWGETWTSSAKKATRYVVLLSLIFALAVWILGTGRPTVCWVDAPPYLFKAIASPLSVFQIREPVPAFSASSEVPCGECGHAQRQSSELSNNKSAYCCTLLLMNHSFAWSYGHPFVGFYQPPSCLFNTVTFNFTVASRGRQFDRLGTLFLGDVEIFRTSTAEPTENGISWTYLKDVSHYLVLFQTSQKIIFDLGNLIDDTYTAPFNATLTASFFMGPSEEERASAILPISSKRAVSNSSSTFSLPSDNATVTVPFPRNVRRAVVSISACGQADEEFWFGNVFESDRDAFPKISPMLGYSPFREVQLLIDGKLAGVVWPFPIIFTGGVVPGLWRPLVGIDAFDLRENEIDITPWLPLLCDGDSAGHTFEIRVVGIEDDGEGSGKLSNAVRSYWVVTGKIFLWLNPPDSKTIGALFFAETEEPFLSLSSTYGQNSTGDNTTLAYRTDVRRRISVSSVIFAPGRKVKLHKWTQVLDYSSRVNFTNAGGVQLIDQWTKGVDMSTSGYIRAYAYPLWVNTSFVVDEENGDFSIDAPIRRGLHLQTYGPAVLPTGKEAFAEEGQIDGVALHTTQNGSAHYLGVPSKRKAYGHGITEQKFDFRGRLGPKLPDLGSRQSPTSAEWRELYKRYTVATNGTITRDRESIRGEISRDVDESSLATHPFEDMWVETGPREFLGRGPTI